VGLTGSLGPPGILGVVTTLRLIASDAEEAALRREGVRGPCIVLFRVTGSSIFAFEGDWTFDGALGECIPLEIDTFGR
jgi:hypothetical protein